MDPVLDIQRLSIRYAGAPAPAVRDVSFTLGRERLGIVGESGSGKSTVGRAIMRLLDTAEITADRARLRRIIAKGDANAQRRAWLSDQAVRYGLAAEKQDTAPPVRLAQRLLRHVDTVPVSLALAQAAAESGWGRSRFAHDGNALYGQWTMSEAHGLVPQRRDVGKKHLVRQFGSLLNSVRAYMRNLNSHPAYRTFRAARATARGRGQALDGAKLAHHLEAYSERGAVYIDELRAIMRVNGLGRFDGAILIPERRV